MQNNTGTSRLITDNIIAGFLTTGMQIKPDDQEICNNFTVTGNTWFAPTINDYGRGYLTVGANQSQDLNFNHNFVHALDVDMPGLWGQTYSQTDEHQCNDNFFYRTDTDGAFTCEYGNNEDIKDPNNISLPVSKAFLRPNRYDATRAHLIVLNGERKADVSLSLGTFAQAGERIAILNSLDPFGEPLAIGIYNGEYFNLHWPQSDWIVEPVSSALTKDPSTVEREFWAFVVVKLNS